jgi:hypothetical protein
MSGGSNPDRQFIWIVILLIDAAGIRISAVKPLYFKNLSFNFKSSKKNK